MTGSLLIAGSLAQRPHIGGHTWVFLQYLLGFRRLGWRVLFLDWLDPEMCIDETGRVCPLSRSVNLRYFLEVMRQFDLEGDFSLIDRGSGQTIGLSRAQILERARESAFLLNVMGFLRDDEILGSIPRRVFLDIDPGFGQMWHDLGLHDPFAGHDVHVTIALNVGQPDCTIPTCGLTWITTLPPIILDRWPRIATRGKAFTTIASWRGAYGPVPYQGTTYGLRAHEFRRFAALPRLTHGSFRLALAIHEAETKDRSLLAENGWSLLDPREIAGDPLSYQSFIQGSGAEFLVAKGMYVQTRGGWISDRSLGYLASGRPVLAQETGFSRHCPTGEGLLSFSTLDEAIAGVEAITSRPARHAAAARDLAEAYFDSDKVLDRLLAQLGAA
jgi:hypothetical protein